MNRGKFILFAAFILVSCNAVKPRKKTDLLLSSNKPMYDAIIVPGVPYYHDSVSFILEARIKWSIFLYNNGIAKNIIYSGADVYSPYVEGKVMKLIAEQNGVPANVIYVDSISEHGTENLYYSYKMAQRLGFNKVALATDPYQAAMLSFFRGTLSRKFKIQGGIPVLSLDPKEADKVDLNIDNIPDYLAYDSTFVPIYERKSAPERFFSSMGGNIKWED